MCVTSLPAGALAFEAPPSSEKGSGSTSSFAFKRTKTKTVHFGSYPKIVNLNKTSCTHCGDIRYLFYILQKGAYKSSL